MINRTGGSVSEDRESIPGEDALSRETGDLYEELQLAEGCRSKLYLQVIYILDIMMKFNAVCLLPHKKQTLKAVLIQVDGKENIKKLQQESPGKFLSLSSKANIPPKSLSRFYLIRWIWRLYSSPVGRSGRFFVVTYATIKSITFAYFLYQRDVALSYLIPQVASNANRTEKCARRADIYYRQPKSSGQDNYKQFQNSCEWIDYIAGVDLTLPGVSALTTGIAGFLIAVFYFYPRIYLIFYPIKTDLLDFIYEPLEHRRRMQQRLIEVTKCILHSLQMRTTSADYGKTNETCNCSSVHLFGNSQLGRYWALSARRRRGSKMEESELRSENLRFSQLLTSIHMRNQVKPANLSSIWHRKLLKLMYVVYIAATVFTFVTSMCSTVGLIIYELHLRTQYRLQAIECLKWNADAVFVADQLRMSSVKMDIHDEAAYVDYREEEGSLLSHLYLVLWVESRYFLTRRALIYLFEVSVVYFFVSFWAAFYTLLFIFGSLHQAVWLLQVERQSKKLVELSAHHAIQKEKQIPGSFGCSAISDRKFTKALTLGYLNHELFRRNQTSFNHMFNFLVCQVTALSLATFTMCYFIASNVQALTLVPIYYSMFSIACLMNSYLYMSSYITKKAQRVMRIVTCFMAYCCSGSQDRNYPLELWRRQLASDDQLRHVFAANLLGFYISYEQFISFNLYLVALCLFLFKRTEPVQF